MQPLPFTDLNGLTSPITALCAQFESGELTWRQAHDALVDLSLRRASALLDPEAREDLAAFLRALPLAEASHQAVHMRF